jgi:hypothetical protein
MVQEGIKDVTTVKRETTGANGPKNHESLSYPFPTEEGTPQGGICSPVIANMALDGLERLLAAHFPKKGRPEKRAKVNLIRYADDFCSATRGRLC